MREHQQHKCNEMTSELEHPRRWIILFYFYFYLLCNNLKYMGHCNSKGVHGTI